MDQKRAGFFTGFVSASVISAAMVWAGAELYTPTTSWIRDTSKYDPATADQINVLADLAPGTAVQMLEIGARLNALNGAAKRKNWNHANYQLDEMEAAFEKLQITRPSRAVAIQDLLDNDVPPVRTAILAADKAAFQTALEGLTTACTTCHQNSGFAYLVVKPGKSAAPIE